MHPDGATMVVTRGGELRAISRATLEERRIFAFGGAQLGECSMGPDGDWLVAAFAAQAARGLVVSRFLGSGSTLIPFPRTVIHPLFHPLRTGRLPFPGHPAPL